MSTAACLFCRIVRRELPATIVYEDAEVLAFRDVAPKAPVHCLIIPKRHVAGLQALQDGEARLMASLFTCLMRVAREEGVSDAGYRAVVNAGSDGGQTVFHLHLHLLGGRQMTWPPG
jgi:histidine triad (HIT) family protein